MTPHQHSGLCQTNVEPRPSFPLPQQNELRVGSLLLEVGSDANSLEEAERAASLAGKALAAILLGEAD